MNTAPDVTQLLVAWGKGDEAALEKLAPMVEHELHRLALRCLSGERGGNSLQATALVNEAYLRLIDWKNVEWQSRAHFFAVAAKMMRRILVTHAWRRRRQKRGGEAILVSLAEATAAADAPSVDTIALDDALNRLEAFDERKSRIVEMRFFGGLSEEETAEVMQLSLRTVQREWGLARAWLFRELA